MTPESNDNSPSAEAVSGIALSERLMSLAPRDRIRMLIMSKGYRSLSAWARAQTPPLFPQQVDFCINGTREYRDIRKLIADEIGVDPATVDAWIAEQVELDKTRLAS